MILDCIVPAVYDGKALIPEKPVNLQAGKKYLLIIEDIPPNDSQITGIPETKGLCETAYMSERVLAREWLTPEEDKAWEFL